MGSVHLSGVASLSSRYRTALSRCPLPCFAAVRSELPFDFGLDWDRREGRDKSVELVLNVCENQPDSRVGRSPMRVPVDVGEYEDGLMSDAGRSDRVRARGTGTGSMITGGSSILLTGEIGGGVSFR
jgi:hypothetical protein